MLAYDLPQTPADERKAAIREFMEVAAERRRLALRGARAVQELVRTGAYFHAGAASIGHFAEMHGMSALEAREMQSVAFAIESDPSLCAEIERGTIPVASAAVLGEITPAIERPGDRWVEWAKSKSTRELRRMFLCRRDEAQAGQPVTPVTAYVTAGVRDDLDRARRLASRSAHRALTLGQALGILVGDWLHVHDSLRTVPGVRRLPDTAGIPASRYVPAEVDRLVRARSADACIVPYCDCDIWIHRSHRQAHADGGSREADNLDLLCDYHHVLYEAGLIRIEGPPDDPIVKDEHGRLLDARNPFGFDEWGRPPPEWRAGATGVDPPSPGPPNARGPEGPGPPSGASAEVSPRTDATAGVSLGAPPHPTAERAIDPTADPAGDPTSVPGDDDLDVEALFTRP